MCVVCPYGLGAGFGSDDLGPLSLLLLGLPGSEADSEVGPTVFPADDDELGATEPVGTTAPGCGALGASGAPGVCTTVNVDGDTVTTWVCASGTTGWSAAGASLPPPPRFATATATAVAAAAQAAVIAKRLPRRGRGTTEPESDETEPEETGSATAAPGSNAGNPRLASCAADSERAH